MQIRYEKAITYVRCDEGNGFPILWGAAAMWKSLSERMDLLYVPGTHLEMMDDTRGKMCGTMMMTTAAMKFSQRFQR